jgi:hypothetical protein
MGRNERVTRSSLADELTSLKGGRTARREVEAIKKQAVC